MQGPPPAKYDVMVESWRDLHPHWEIKTWTEEEMKPLAVGPWVNVLDQCTLLIQRADIYRMIVLERYGGVYIDCDMHTLKSLEPLVHETRIQIGGCHGSISSAFIKVNNGIILAPAAHPAWRTCVIPELLRAFSTSTILDALVTIRVIRTTGPLVWGRIVTRSPQDFLVHPPNAFYSLRIKKREHVTDQVKQQLLGSYVYHAQDSSWLSGWERGVMVGVMNIKWVICILTWILFMYCVR